VWKGDGKVLNWSELLNVTEEAALAASGEIGRGRKNEADGEATDAMRRALNAVPVAGVVVIGEGELDEAPMLYIGESVGSGTGPAMDVAVDPVEGTELLASGEWGAMSIIGMAPRGSLLHAPDMYMQKLAVGPEAAGAVHLDAPIAENLTAIARAKGKRIENVVVAVQRRERHASLIAEIREAGASVRLFEHGDVAMTMMAGLGQGIDALMGIGGAPEGVLSAIAFRCLGGEFQGRLMPVTPAEVERCIAMGIPDPTRSLTMADLVRSCDCWLAATGITSGPFLRGVETGPQGVFCHSLVMAGNGMIRFVETTRPNRTHGMAP